MPGRNGTGPLGMGPRTGGGRGFCQPGTGGYQPLNAYGDSLRGAGRGGIPWGCGRGRVFGGGRSRRLYGPAGYRPDSMTAPDPEQELGFLKTRASAMEQELEQIRRRIEELQKNGYKPA